VDLTSVVLAVPVIWDLLNSPKMRPFGYLAADAFYYLNVARNWVQSGLPSYDGVRPTNGFHPLWQACVAAMYAILRVLHVSLHAPLVAVIVSLVCVILALRYLGRAWVRSDGEVSVLFAAIPFGAYPLIVLYQYLISYSSRGADGGNEGPMILHGTLYSFVNGMESPLVLLTFCVAAWVFVSQYGKYDLKSGALHGSVLSALCLARLDHTVFVLTPAAVWGLQLLYARDRRRFAAAALLTLVLPIFIYLGVNQLYAGSMVPVSGTAKSSFPIPMGEGINFFRGVLDAPTKRISLHTLYRFGPSVVSAVLAGCYFVLALRIVPAGDSWTFGLANWAKRLDRFLLYMTPGVVGLSAYNLLFAMPAGIGHWYQPASLLYDSIVVIRLFSALVACLPVSSLFGRWCGLVAAAAGSLVGFWFCHYSPHYHEMYARFYWESVPRIHALLPARNLQIYEMDDGIVAFGIGAPAMSATGLALDHEATELARTRRRVDIALDRGFRVVGAMFYNSHTLTMNSSSTEAIYWASATLGEDVNNHNAKVLYTDSAGTLVQIE
jgi:hypothetical protein